MYWKYFKSNLQKFRDYFKFKKDDKVITSVKKIKKDDELVVELTDGLVSTKVLDIKESKV